jgi:hypothetical protein
MVRGMERSTGRTRGAPGLSGGAHLLAGRFGGLVGECERALDLVGGQRASGMHATCFLPSSEVRWSDATKRPRLRT